MTYIGEVQKAIDFAKSKMLRMQEEDSNSVPAEFERLIWAVIDFLEFNMRTQPEDSPEVDLQTSLDLVREADMRGIKMWQEAHPGNDLVWPDRGKMIFWLLEQLK